VGDVWRIIPLDGQYIKPDSDDGLDDDDEDAPGEEDGARVSY
jgi:hypothetical protein